MRRILGIDDVFEIFANLTVAVVIIASIISKAVS